MKEQEWLDKVEQLSSEWKDRCELVVPTTAKYQLSRMVFESVWRIIDWDLKILREILKDNGNWIIFEALQRLKFEGTLRGFWIEECATDDQIEGIVSIDESSTDLNKLKLVTRGHFPRVDKLLSDLKSKEVPFINKRNSMHKILYENAHDSAHMSVWLMHSSHVEREIWSDLRSCFFEMGICALRISRISSDKSHVNAIQKECEEVLRELDSQIQELPV